MSPPENLSIIDAERIYRSTCCRKGLGGIIGSKVELNVKRLVVLALLMAPSCWASDKVVGPCYHVKGRLSYYNGAPSTRIWIVGTHRMLGIPSEDSELPADVKALLKSFDDEIFADFLVCPLTKERPGTMRMVLVKSASHVVDRPDHGN